MFSDQIKTINQIVSDGIEESGKGTSEGYSEFICPENTVITGRKHKGDENGETWYWTSLLVLEDVICKPTNTSGWISVGKESGKGTSEGYSEFICPENTVITGRKHKGDENGETWYQYSFITVRAMEIETYDKSGWISVGKESGKGTSEGYSEFICPENTVITGRKHKGDENGETWYQYSKLRVI